MLSQPDYIPSYYPRIALAASVSAMVNAAFGPANCILYPRRLTGDFNALARYLYSHFNVMKTGINHFIENDLSLTIKEEAVAAALQAVKDDMRALKQQSFSPRLRVVGGAGYPATFFGLKSKASKVYEFHADRVRLDLNDKGGRIACCYNAPVTEFIRNEDAVRLPLSQHFYRARKNAPVFSFRPGDLWLQACRGLPVLPFLHRAAPVGNITQPRLMLLAD